VTKRIRFLSLVVSQKSYYAARSWTTKCMLLLTPLFLLWLFSVLLTAVWQQPERCQQGLDSADQCKPQHLGH
jgi:hypothetical protein